uniref:Arb2 domain-containing protein n=1 Tax=Globisporangium ultimum (strain ATCC 200006 / CBS 805.95 / DAOM BR144) TaxID=431595 RepID=K3WD33_GLOUD
MGNMTNREMDTISEDSMPPVHTAEWANDRFEMNDKGEVRNKQTNERITKDEMRDHGEEVLKGLIEYVHTRMLREFQFVEQAIPALEEDRSSVASSFNPNMSMYSTGSSVRSSSSSICSTADGFRMMVDSDVPRCIFHTSENFGIAEKLLVFVCSSRGLSCGIWSRSLLLHDGVTVGSMIPYFQAAIKAGYGILVMNPNMNTQIMIGADGEPEKLSIHGSSTQEEHCEHVWKKYIFPSAAHKIHFIAYGYGGQLVTNLIDQYKYELKNRLGNVAFIESSHKIDPKWNPGFKRWFSQHCVCWIRSSEPLDTDLTNSDRDSASSYNTASTDDSEGGYQNQTPSASQLMTFGCLCLSAGPCEGPGKSPAFTAKSVLKDVFEFLASPSAYEYQRTAAKTVRMNALIEEEMQQRARHTERAKNSPVGRQSRKVSYGSKKLHRQPSRSCPEELESTRPPEAVTIEDFQLLRVVGKGAFGK